MQKFAPLSAQKWRKFLCVIQSSASSAFYNILRPNFAILLLDALSSCSDGFRSSCLDQNLVYSWNRPFEKL